MGELGRFLDAGPAGELEDGVGLKNLEIELCCSLTPMRLELAPTAVALCCVYKQTHQGLFGFQRLLS